VSTTQSAQHVFNHPPVAGLGSFVMTSTAVTQPRHVQTHPVAELLLHSFQNCGSLGRTCKAAAIAPSGSRKAMCLSATAAVLRPVGSTPGSILKPPRL
jgi:hypothetical protein